MKKFVASVLLVLVLPAVAFASATDGTIDAASKYAWGERIGWLNFGTSGGNVHVTDAGLTGYVWSEHYGWINLAPAGGGVVNDAEGNLSGSAWGENLGYVNFAGTTISATGQFSGIATGNAIAGRISFNCPSCTVLTDWRPASARGGGGNTGGTTTGGGGGFPPPSGLGVIVNGGDAITNTSSVTLTLRGDPQITHVKIANFPDFRDSVIEPYVPAKTWDLCAGRAPCPTSSYAVYVQFYTSIGAPHAQAYGVFSDDIFYAAGGIPPTAPPQTPPRGGIPGLIDRVIDGIFGGRPPEGTPIAEIIIPREAPVALRGRWQLIPEPPVREFVFAPLPRSIAMLAQKLPGFGRTLRAVGVSGKKDIPKFRDITLSLPNLTESMFQSQGRVPTGIVFARAGGGSVDLDARLLLDERGEAEQRIRAVAGSIVELAVRPDAPAKRVSGYMTFTSREQEAAARRAYPSVPAQAMLGAIVFSAPTVHVPSSESPLRWLAGVADAWNALVGDAGPAPEERFSVREFVYDDKDGDGLYTATVQTPVVDGTYDIYTVVDYEDAARPSEEIKITALIDPEGYVYERSGAKEIRIPGAVVALHWLNPETKQYELWPAKPFNQENPQITDVRGTYAFLVPPGWYYLAVAAPGYDAYEGKAFEVQSGGSGVHMNIELTSPFNWLRILDWKTALLIILAALIAVNFWRDRRERNTGGLGPGVPS